MPKLVINLSSHPEVITVSQMRKRLAQVLSKLNGDQEVSFNFIATLDNYQPAATSDVYTDRANTLGVSRETAKALSVGLGYTFGGDLSAVIDPYCAFEKSMTESLASTFIRQPRVLAKPRILEAPYGPLPTAVFGELARPENE